MAIFISTQLIAIIVFALLGWAIKHKKNYDLISGFANRSKEEQEQLIANGYPQRVGSLLLITAVCMLILLSLVFTPFKYVIETQLIFMILFLMGGIIYLSRYEVPSKRKKSYIISSVIAIVTIGLIAGLSISAYKDFDVVVKDKTFEVKGQYGDEWQIKDITHIELMEEMPEITWKVNGVGVSNMAKGVFKVKNYGKSLLFIKKKPPYIYIKVNDQHIFLNEESPEKTKKLYDKLKEKINQ